MRIIILVAIFFIPSTGLTVQKNFSEEVDNLWQAIEMTMSDYQIKLNDVDKGIIETDFVSGKSMWIPPQSTKSYIGYSTKILIRLLKGKKSHKLILKKIIKYKPDFFAEEKFVDSDVIEEQVLLYRIGRELSIQKKLAKANEDSSETP